MILLCASASLWFNQPVVAQQVPLDNLPAAPELPPYQWFASTDPHHKNADYIELQPGETKRIPLAAGRLLRLWSTGFEPDKLVLAIENGQRTVLLSDGQAKYGTFAQKSYTLYPTGSTPPPVRALKNGATLVATNHSKQPNKWFYQVSVGEALPGFPNVPSTELTSQTMNVAPGARKELELQATGGVLSHLQLTLQPATLETLRRLHLRARWDAETPGAPETPLPLDVPLSALIAQFYDLRKVRAETFSWDGKTLELRWPMPYGAGARLWLENAGAQPVQVQAHLRQNGLLSPYRFCARYGSARTQKGEPLDILKANGSGAFVGLALGIAPAADTTRRTFAYLEGNEIITADNHQYEGTGTEDYFNSAWYFPEKPFTRPYAGVTYKGQLPPRVSMYRLMIPDAVPFKKSLQFRLEHGNGNNSNDLEYSWAAFWYQAPPPQFEIQDALAQAQVAAAAEGAGEKQPLVWVALGFLSLVVVLGIVARRSRKKTREARGE